MGLETIEALRSQLIEATMKRKGHDFFDCPDCDDGWKEVKSSKGAFNGTAKCCRCKGFGLTETQETLTETTAVTFDTDQPTY